jgi:uncharacterized protein YjbJ (UPF0337 family)
MNWDIVEGKWTQFTDDDLDQIAGKKDRLVGMLQERYGRRRDEAERDIDAWLSNSKSPRA